MFNSEDNQQANLRNKLNEIMYSHRQKKKVNIKT
jgi:hypothetical protein